VNVAYGATVVQLKGIMVALTGLGLRLGGYGMKIPESFEGLPPPRLAPNAVSDSDALISVVNPDTLLAESTT